MARFRDFLRRTWRKSKAPSRGRVPRKPLAPVEEIVDQGLLVADVAVRMSVKNAIIMNALKRRVNYNPEQVRELVTKTIVELADERERDAKHIQRVRDEIRSYGRSSWSETEYGNDDTRTLKHRYEVYQQLSNELHDRSKSADYVNGAAERAWEAAWIEIGDSLKERASHPYYGGGASEEYQRERDSRIQLFIERELTDLVQAQSEPRPAPAPKKKSLFPVKSKVKD